MTIAFTKRGGCEGCSVNSRLSAALIPESSEVTCVGGAKESGGDAARGVAGTGRRYLGSSSKRQPYPKVNAARMGARPATLAETVLLTRSTS